jgi:hypothetical protein
MRDSYAFKEDIKTQAFKRRITCNSGTLKKRNVHSK